MFNSHQDQSIKENIDPKQLIIIYSDKVEKRFANILSEKISKNSKKLRAVIWSRKQYEDNLPRLSSINKKLAIGIELRNDFASDPNLADVYSEDGVHIRIDGNSCLIYQDNITWDKWKLIQKEYKKAGKKELVTDISTLAGSAFFGPIPLFGASIIKFVKLNKFVTISQYSIALDVMENTFLESFLDNE